MLTVTEFVSRFEKTVEKARLVGCIFSFLAPDRRRRRGTRRPSGAGVNRTWWHRSDSVLAAEPDVY
jgi:hypothetical protein